MSLTRFWRFSLLLVPLLLTATALAQQCPAERSGLASGSSLNKVGLTFRNNVGSKVSIIWVNNDGDEMPLSEVDIDEEYNMESYTGHVWRGRELASGTLVFEHVVGEASPKEMLPISRCAGLPANDAPDASDDLEWSQTHGKRVVLAAEGCQLDALLTKDDLGKMRGFHVMCAVQNTAGQVERLCIFADGMDSDYCSHTVALQGDETISAIATLVRIRVDPKWKPFNSQSPVPAIFTASGRRVPKASTLAQAGVPEKRKALVLILGGVWHWPSIREGFERPTDAFVHTKPHSLSLRTLSLRPRVFGVTSFIADEECDRILEVAGPKVRKSAVSVKDADHGKDVDTWRTSANFFLSSAGDPILEAMDVRVQNLTRVPITHSEHIQVLKYDYDGRYVSHTDYFDPKDYRKDKGTLRLISDGAWNRLFTVFMYMSDVPEGGHTVFPYYGGRKGFVPFESCDTGYKVKPERRKVIIFYNMHPNGQLDPDSMHGGCKVKNGTKWSGNFWFWNVPQNFKHAPVHRDMASALDEWDEAMDREEEKMLSEFAASLQKKEEL